MRRAVGFRMTQIGKASDSSELMDDLEQVIDNLQSSKIHD